MEGIERCYRRKMKGLPSLQIGDKIVNNCGEMFQKFAVIMGLQSLRWSADGVQRAIGVFARV